MDNSDILLTLRETIRKVDKLKSDLGSLTDDTIAEDNDMFVNGLSNLFASLKTLAEIPENESYQRQESQGNLTNGTTSKEEPVFLKDIKVPPEFIDLVDSTSKLTDPRLLVAFKKKSALEEKERLKRCNKAFGLIAGEISNYLGSSDTKIENNVKTEE